MKFGLVSIAINDLEQLPHDVLKHLLQQVVNAPDPDKNISEKIINSINHIINLREYTDIPQIHQTDPIRTIINTIRNVIKHIDGGGYIVHIVETAPAECARECSICVNNYHVYSIQEIIDLVIDAFDLLPSTDWEKLPMTYKQFEDQYIRNCMDCAPLYVSIFDIAEREFIKPLTMSQYYICYKQYRKTNCVK